MPRPSRSRTRATPRWSGWPTSWSTPSRRSWRPTCRPAGPRPAAAKRPTSTHEMTRGGARRAATAIAVAVALLVPAALLAGRGGPRAEYAGVSGTIGPQDQGQGRPADGLHAARDFRSIRGYRSTPVPVRLEIPAIGVATGLQRLHPARRPRVGGDPGPRRLQGRPGGVLPAA